jgi:hypothetical protein
MRDSLNNRSRDSGPNESTAKRKSERRGPESVPPPRPANDVGTGNVSRIPRYRCRCPRPRPRPSPNRHRHRHRHRHRRLSRVGKRGGRRRSLRWRRRVHAGRDGDGGAVPLLGEGGKLTLTGRQAVILRNIWRTSPSSSNIGTETRSLTRHSLQRSR